MGCSGIDMYGGSLAFMSGKGLVDAAKNLGQNAQSYAFQLALKTYAPQMENLLSKLRDLAMELNQFAVEDCQAIQSLFAAGLPKNTAMYETVCRDLETSGGKDYFGTRSSCRENAKARSAAQTKLAGSDTLIDNFNLFIFAAKKASIPKDMLESMMSIAGTIVVKDGKRSFYDSFAADDDTYKAHLKGGQVTQYSCQGNLDKCLNIVSVKSEISQEQSYQGMAIKKLEAIKKKMLDNTPFDDNDVAFLTSIGENLPIYNYISLEVVTGSHIIDISADILASYMMQYQLGKVIHEVRQSLQLLAAEQIDDQYFKEYVERLDFVQNLIRQKEPSITKENFRLSQTAQTIEAHFSAKLR
jgi:conjugative transfer pilus assembly protein TraH